MVVCWQSLYLPLYGLYIDSEPANLNRVVVTAQIVQAKNVATIKKTQTKLMANKDFV